MKSSFFLGALVLIGLVQILSTNGRTTELRGRPPRPERNLRSIPIIDVESAAVSRKRYHFEFRNESDRSIRYMEGLQGPKSCASLELSLFKDGNLIPWSKTYEGPSWVKSAVRILKPKDALEGVVALERYRALMPGRYQIRAKYNVKKKYGIVKEFGLTPLAFDRTVMILNIVESLPKKLNQLTQLRIKRVTEKSHYFLGVDVGLGPVWDKKATLFVALRESAPGKSKLNDPPKKIFRPLRVDPKARVETMVYNPFPLSTEPIIQVHVLVTEPNKPQRHFVIGQLSSGAAAAEIKKDETLKPGTLYKLHKDGAGSVRLVPRGSK